jgi:membrane associated rhomboid family serine protease
MELPAVLVIGLWFLSQLFNGTASVVDRKHLAGGGVAWWAHVGGFITGIILMKVMQPRQRSGIGEWLDPG